MATAYVLPILFGIKTSERISAFDRVASDQLIGLDFIRFD